MTASVTDLSAYTFASAARSCSSGSFHREVDQRRRAAAEDRALQLVLHDVLHPLELGHERIASRLAAVDQAAQCRERRLEAVGEVAERRAIAFGALALAHQESVQVAGDARELARPARAEGLAAAGLDLDDLLLEAPQRPERNPQCRREAAEQEQREQDRAGDEAGAHAQQLAMPGLEALRRANDEIPRSARLRLPPDAERKAQHARAVRKLRVFETPLARPRPGREVEPAADRRWRAPAAARAEDFRVQPRSRRRQARFGQVPRHEPAVRLELRRRQERDHLRIEDVLERTAAEVTVQGIERDGRRCRGDDEERRERQQQPRLQRRCGVRHGQPRAIR